MLPGSLCVSLFTLLIQYPPAWVLPSNHLSLPPFPANVLTTYFTEKIRVITMTLCELHASGYTSQTSACIHFTFLYHACNFSPPQWRHYFHLPFGSHNPCLISYLSIIVHTFSLSPSPSLYYRLHSISPIVMDTCLVLFYLKNMYYLPLFLPSLLKLGASGVQRYRSVSSWHLFRGSLKPCSRKTKYLLLCSVLNNFIQHNFYKLIVQR